METSALLALPGEVKNRIYDLALPTKSIIPVRAQGHARRRCSNICGLYGCFKCVEAGPSMRFEPAQPSLTKTSRQLAEETHNYYYTSNTFLFTDSILQAGVLSALKEAQPGMTMIKHLKVNQTLQNIKALPTGYHLSFIVRFAARLEDRDQVTITDIRTAVAGKSHDKFGNLEFCVCFIKAMGQSWPASDSEGSGILFQFLDRYLTKVMKIETIGKVVCNDCGEFQAE